jgi:hypothetical protein
MDGVTINSYFAIAMQSVKAKGANVPNMLVESSFLMEKLTLKYWQNIIQNAKQQNTTSGQSS